MDNQVVITYKRKRCSSAQKLSPKPSIEKSSTPQGTSPDVDFGDDNEKQKKEYLEKWLCSTCNKNEHKSLQHYIRDSRRGKKGKRIEELDMGPTDHIKLDPPFLNSFNESKSRPECPGDSSMISMTSDDNDDHPKERKPPLLTFHRRPKKKPIESDKIADGNSLEEKQHHSSINWNGHAQETLSVYEESSQICRSQNKSRSAAVLKEAEDAGLGSAPAGGVGETKILQEVKTSRQTPGSSQLSADLPGSEDQSDKLMAVSAIDLNKSSFPTDDSNQQNSVKIVIPLGVNVPGKRACQCEPRLSVALLISACKNNVEPDEESDGRGKELQWLEDLDRVLQERKKSRDTPSVVEDGGDGGQESNRRDSTIVPKLPSKSSIESTANQGASPEYMNQMTPLQAQVLTTNLHRPGYKNGQHKEMSNGPSLYTNLLGLPECEKHNHEEILNQSSLCTNCLRVPLPLNPEVPSVSGIKDNHTPIMHSPWHAYDETSFLSRHRKIVEIDRTGTKLSLRERQGLVIDKYRRYSNEWSDKELDFLWIGVRRHGANNWNAILRDPKLHFIESRTAEELLIQWDLEQRKLLSGTSVQPLRLSKTDCSSSSSTARVIHDILLARPVGSRSELPMFTSDTKFSLGNAYRQRRNVVHSSGENSQSFAGYQHQMPVRAHNTMYDWGPSILHQRDGKFVSGRHKPAGPSGLRNGEPSAPPKDSRGRGILKRKRVGLGNKNVGLRINDAPSSQKSVLDNSALEKISVSTENINTSVPIEPSNLEEVIDCGASSEETISDDQNSRLS